MHGQDEKKVRWRRYGDIDGLWSLEIDAAKLGMFEKLDSISLLG